MSNKKPMVARTVALRLEKINAYIHCAKVAAHNTNTEGAMEAAELLLHVENLIFELMCDLDHSYSGEIDSAADEGAS